MADATRNVRTNFDGNATDLVRAADRAGDSIERFAKRARLATLGLGAVRTAALAFGPALIPVIAAATAGAAGLAGALTAAGAATGVFGAALIGNFAAVVEAQEEIVKLDEKLAEADTTEERTKATEELAKAHAKLTPELSATVTQYTRMKTAWQQFLLVNQPRTLGLLTTFFAGIAAALPKLQPLFDVAATAAERFFKPITDSVSGGGLDRFVSWAADAAGPALASLSGIITNLGASLVNIGVAFTPVGQQILDVVEDLTLKFREWSEDLSPTGGLGAFMAYVQANGPQLGDTLSEMGDALLTIAEAIGPLAPLSLAAAEGLAGIVEAIPPDVLGGMVVSVIALNVALSAMNLILLSTPVGIFVLALGALATAFYVAWQNSETFRNGVLTALSGVGLAALALVETVLRALRALTENLLSFIATLATGAAGFLKALGLDDAAQAMLDTAEAVSGFRDRADEEFGAAIAKTQEWASAVENMPKEIRLKGEISDLVAKIADARRRLAAAPEDKKVQIEGEIRQLQRALAVAQARINGLTGRSVTISVRAAWDPTLTRLSPRAIEGRQHGGPVLGGRSYIVGEAGPEILDLNASGTGGQVIPLSSGSSGGGGGDSSGLAKAVAAAINGATLIIDDRGMGTLIARRADLYARAG